MKNTSNGPLIIELAEANSNSSKVVSFNNSILYNNSCGHVRGEIALSKIWRNHHILWPSASAKAIWRLNWTLTLKNKLHLYTATCSKDNYAQCSSGANMDIPLREQKVILFGIICRVPGILVWFETKEEIPYFVCGWMQHCLKKKLKPRNCPTKLHFFGISWTFSPVKLPQLCWGLLQLSHFLAKLIYLTGQNPAHFSCM